MSTLEASDNWQIEVAGTVYQASLEELPSWIADGSLQPADKVRKGNLRWIEASKVPVMAPLFEAKANGSLVPEVAGIRDIASSWEPQTNDISRLEGKSGLPEGVKSPVLPAPKVIAYNKDRCSIHSSVESAFICSSCDRPFCRSCPRSYGGSVKICPTCGSMCRPIREQRDISEREKLREDAIAEGFGLSDFVNALRHPLRFKFSLIAGAVMFTVFSIGQSAAVIGGIEMIVASIFCLLLANMLTFGVLANTVDKFSLGELNENFMPQFEDFSILDDVVRPFVLSLGSYASSFGAFALVLLIGFYAVSTSVDSKMSALQSELEKIPGTEFYTAKDTVKQSDEVKNLLAQSQRQNADRLRLQNEIANTDTPTQSVNRESVENTTHSPEGALQDRSESVLGKTAATSEIEKREMLQSTLGLPPVVVVIGVFAFLWGIFYFPAACIVAGFSRTLSATLDPRVGFDTIKRLGITYAKLVSMEIVLLLILLIVRMISASMFESLDIPGFGNLPAKVVTSFFGFYLWVAFACLIGYCLFKSYDRLQLNK